MDNPFTPGESPLNMKSKAPGLGGRATAIKAISANWKPIVAHAGQVYVTAKEVLDAMHALDISYSSNGQKLKKSNAIGDILGKHAMKLPSEVRDGRKYYFLAAIDMEPEERQAFSLLSDQEKGRKVQAIIDGLKKEPKAETQQDNGESNAKLEDKPRSVSFATSDEDDSRGFEEE